MERENSSRIFRPRWSRMHRIDTKIRNAPDLQGNGNRNRFRETASPGSAHGIGVAGQLRCWRARRSTDTAL